MHFLFVLWKLCKLIKNNEVNDKNLIFFKKNPTLSYFFYTVKKIKIAHSIAGGNYLVFSENQGEVGPSWEKYKCTMDAGYKCTHTMSWEAGIIVVYSIYHQGPREKRGLLKLLSKVPIRNTIAAWVVNRDTIITNL